MKTKTTPHHRADTTRTKILKHARHLFTQHGFAGTSMSMIATKAKINRSLIFHHFTNKQNLWVVVKQDITARAIRKAPILPDIKLPWKEYLKQWLNNNINFYRNNPDIIAMLNWQRTEHKDAQHIGITQSTESKKWLFSLEHFQQKGDIGKHINLGFAISIIGAISSSAALDPNIFILNEKDFDAYIEFCVDQLVTGLA